MTEFLLVSELSTEYTDIIVDTVLCMPGGGVFRILTSILSFTEYLKVGLKTQNSNKSLIKNPGMDKLWCFTHTLTQSTYTTYNI